MSFFQYVLSREKITFKNKLFRFNIFKRKYNQNFNFFTLNSK